MCAAIAAIVLLAFAGSASAQDWMVTPPPAVPLHVEPLTPAPPPPPPATGPTVRSAPTHDEAQPRTSDPIRRLLDPYGLDARPYSRVPAPEAARTRLPSFWLVVPWTGSLVSSTSRILPVSTARLP